MKITVSYGASNGDYFEKSIDVDSHCTVRIAIERSKIVQDCDEIDLTKHRVAVFGRLVKLEDQLHEGDRIEICRPLIIDPKQARVLRANRK